MTEVVLWTMFLFLVGAIVGTISVSFRRSRGDEDEQVSATTMILWIPLVSALVMGGVLAAVWPM